MIVGVVVESHPGERRVALTPEVVGRLGKKKIEVIVERGAGTSAGFPDEAYEAAGAKLASRDEVFSGAEVITQVRASGANRNGESDLAAYREGQVVVGLADPLDDASKVAAVAAKGVRLVSMEMVPRITRAQSMDVLSSQATIGGYKAVLMAANEQAKMFPMMMTAAGTIRPAKAFILGAGVAGLQAIASARRLGAVVQAYDVRPAVKEQVESLGARFVELDLDTAEAEDAGGYAKAQGEDFIARQQALMGDVVAESDVVITTANIPGRKAPILVTKEMVERMPPGAVIIDLAAERGGNCELSVADEVVHHGHVTILGPSNLPATVPADASRMYARNVQSLLELIIDDEGALSIDREDEIIVGCLLTADGEVISERIKGLLDKGEN